MSVFIPNYKEDYQPSECVVFNCFVKNKNKMKNLIKLFRTCENEVVWVFKDKLDNLSNYIQYNSPPRRFYNVGILLE